MINQELIDGRNKKSNENYGNETIGDEPTSLYIENIISDALELEYHKGVFEGYVNLVLHHTMFNNSVEALHQLQKLERLLEVYSLTNQELLNFYRVSAIYYTELIGDYNLAIDYTIKAMKLAEQLGNKKVLMRLKANLGVINQISGNHHLALEYLLESIVYTELNNDEFHLMFDYYNLGEVTSKLEQFTEAESYFLKAYKLASKHEENSVWYNASAGLARIYSKQKYYKKAFDILELAMNNIGISNLTQYELNVIMEMVELQLCIHQKDEAYKILMTYDDQIEGIDNKVMVADYYKVLADVSSLIKDYEKAYNSMVKCNELSNEILDLNSKKAMSALTQTQYKKTISKLETIAHVGRELTILNDIDEVLLEVNTILKETMSIDVIGIGKLTENTLVYNHFYSGTTKLNPFTIDDEKTGSLAPWCIQNKKPIIINDLKTDYQLYSNRPIQQVDVINNELVNSVMYMPLIVKDEVQGVFTIQSYEKFAYTEEDMEMFKIVSSYVGIAIKNITQSEILEKLSVTDSLTGILNRRGFTEFFTQLDKTCESISLIMLDLDLFKNVNDDYGHLAGDLVLISTGEILENLVPIDGCVSRIGGEEFAYLIINHSEKEIQEFTERIRSEIEALEIVYVEQCIRITTSIGVSSVNMTDDYEFNKLYRKADKALYRAKELGRNRVMVYSED